MSEHEQKYWHIVLLIAAMLGGWRHEVFGLCVVAFLGTWLTLGSPSKPGGQ